MIKFEHVEYFIEVSRFQSISHAAKHLFISQQALSRSIQKLEQELGYTLFERISRGIKLTPEGKNLLDIFAPIVQAYQTAALRIKSDQSKSRHRSVTVTVSPGVIRNLSPELIINFQELYKGVKLNIVEMFDKQIEQYIHDDTQHLGLMVAPERLHTEKHNYKIVRQIPSYLLVHKDNPLAARREVSLRELKDERLLMLPKSAYFQDVLNKAVEPFGFSVEPYFESSDIMELLGMVNRGLGSMLCIRQVYDESPLDNCVLIPLVERTFDYTIAFVFQDYAALPAITRIFIEYVVKKVMPFSEDCGFFTQGKRTKEKEKDV